MPINKRIRCAMECSCQYLSSINLYSLSLGFLLLLTGGNKSSQIYKSMYLSSTSTWAGYNIRSIFKQRSTGLNSEFSLSWLPYQDQRTQSALLFTHSALRNTQSLIKDLISGHWVHFLHFPTHYIPSDSLTTSASNIYIYCHPQTDCFIVSQLFRVAWHVGRLKLGLKPSQLYVRLRIRPLGQQAYHVSLGNYKVLCSNSSSSICLFTFYTLLDTRGPNSFEELCMMRAAAENSFARVLKVSKVGDHCWGWPEGSLFNCYYAEVWGRLLFLFLVWFGLLGFMAYQPL